MKGNDVRPRAADAQLVAAVCRVVQSSSSCITQRTQHVATSTARDAASMTTRRRPPPHSLLTGTATPSRRSDHPGGRPGERLGVATGVVGRSHAREQLIRPDRQTVAVTLPSRPGDSPSRPGRRCRLEGTRCRRSAPVAGSKKSGFNFTTAHNVVTAVRHVLTFPSNAHCIGP